MTNNKDLVYYLQSQKFIKSPRIAEAFLANDRKDFVLPDFESLSYFDVPLPILSGQTISQPSTVAFMLERLQVTEGMKVLDVGFGSGWTPALLAYLVGGKGRVVAVERIDPVFEFGKNNLKKYSYKNISLRFGSGFYGIEDSSPFHRILVSASGRGVPKALVGQLEIGGRMIIPIENSIRQIDRISEKKYQFNDFPGFAFVPLIE